MTFWRRIRQYLRVRDREFDPDTDPAVLRLRQQRAESAMRTAQYTQPRRYIRQPDSLGQRIRVPKGAKGV